MMKKNRLWIALALCAALFCFVLTACMNNGSTVTPNADPSGQPTDGILPGTGIGGSANPNADASVTPPLFDWMNMGKGVEEKIGMISEIEKARVVVNGNTALVGVEFDGQYQGEMTERIHDMVAGEVQAADANVQSVAVTAEKEDVEKINSIADRIAAGTPVNELENEIDSIIRNVTTIQ